MARIHGLCMLVLIVAAACGQPTPTRVGLVLHYEASTPEGAVPSAEQMARLKSIVEERLRLGGPGGVVELEEAAVSS